jgi:hypothetical protein
LVFFHEWISSIVAVFFFFFRCLSCRRWENLARVLVFFSCRLDYNVCFRFRNFSFAKRSVCDITTVMSLLCLRTG